jgi:hypothetical protein
MALNIEKELAALRRMTPRELRARYAEVWGEPSRSGNKAYLIKRIAWRLQALEEGTLSERARRRAAGLAREADLRLNPPRDLSGHSGGVCGHTANGRLAPSGGGGDPRVPPVGTAITRPYKGGTVSITVREHGFELEGEIYRSLSAVAKAVTGSHLNGYAFFGLGHSRKRPRPPDRTP